MKDSLGCSKSTRGLCIAVLGASSVGKTALTVRYLTGRFIGEYHSGTDMTYQHTVPYLGSWTTTVELLDVSARSQETDEGLCSLMERAGAFLIIYSLTDSSSLVAAKEILLALPRSAPKLLLGNKVDLEHRRVVPTTEGRLLADRYDCPFYEVSAAENAPVCIKSAYQTFIRQLVSSSFTFPCPAVRFTALSKLLSSLMFKKSRQSKSSSSSTSTSSTSSPTLSPANSALLITDRRRMAIPIKFRSANQVMSI